MRCSWFSPWKTAKRQLFGSRAQGRYRPDFDIDLALKENLDERTVDQLWILFQESDLPFKVDMVVYERIRMSA